MFPDWMLLFVSVVLIEIQAFVLMTVFFLAEKLDSLVLLFFLVEKFDSLVPLFSLGKLPLFVSNLSFLYPVIYMLVCSVWEGRNAGISQNTDRPQVLYTGKCLQKVDRKQYEVKNIILKSDFSKEWLACFLRLNYSGSGNRQISISFVDRLSHIVVRRRKNFI